MIQIRVTCGRGKPAKFAMVDDDDYERVSIHSWHDNGNGYIRSRASINGKRYHILLHRYIWFGDKAVENGNNDAKVVDHVNGNAYDNRRINLRLIDRSENTKLKKINRTPEGFVTMKEAMKLLGFISSVSVYKLVNQKKITKYKVFGTPCFSLEEIKNLVTPQVL